MVEKATDSSQFAISTCISNLNEKIKNMHYGNRMCSLVPRFFDLMLFPLF